MARKPVVQILVGTRKGAFVFSSPDRKKWNCEGPLLKGEEVQHVAQDPREPNRWYAAAGTEWFGPHLHASTDAGKTWALAEDGLTAASIPNATLKRLWWVQAGAADEPGVLYCGADPGMLFRSEDHGAHWAPVDGLNQHASREKWNPGAGGMMVHSIQCLGKGRMIIAISAAGAFRTMDGGQTWEPHNGGVLADFNPDKYPEVGQCVHKLLAHPKRPADLYQQNHCGVYRGTFPGKKWTDISKGLPSRFGFALAVPAAEEKTLFTVPITSAYERYTPEGKLRVGRSRDGGQTWKLMTKGLPQENAWTLVLRNAMSADGLDEAGVYFGTSGGSLYASRNAGDSWQALAHDLPPIYSVSTAVPA